MNEKRGIISGLEYSIVSLQNIKKSLINPENSKKEILWGVGGLIIALTSNLLKISQEIIQQSAKETGANAKDDLKEIQKQFNKFIDDMINGN